MLIQRGVLLFVWVGKLCNCSARVSDNARHIRRIRTHACNAEQDRISCSAY